MSLYIFINFAIFPACSPPLCQSAFLLFCTFLTSFWSAGTWALAVFLSLGWSAQGRLLRPWAHRVRIWLPTIWDWMRKLSRISRRCIGHSSAWFSASLFPWAAILKTWTFLHKWKCWAWTRTFTNYSKIIVGLIFCWFSAEDGGVPDSRSRIPPRSI